MARPTPSILICLFCMFLYGCQASETETISKCIPAGSCDSLTTEAPQAKKTAKVFSADSGDAKNGGKLYGRLCATCHGADGNGVEGMMLPQRLSSGVWQQTRSDADIRLVMERGKGQMPAFGYLSMSDTRDVIRYVRTLRVAPASQGGNGY